LFLLPKNLGTYKGEEVEVSNGRFGPYVKCGAETRSLPSELSPLDVTLAQAVELLAQPKKMRRGFGAPREPLKTFGESPVTKQTVQLLEGRYGAYVTDGETNASVPKGTSIDELTPELVLRLLADRAAMGPSKKASRKKAAPKKAAAPKRAAKKAVKRAPVKKKAAKKKG